MAVKKIYRPERDFWERTFLVEAVRGLAITFRHLVLTWFKPGHKLTYEYPEEKRPVSARFRGRHRIRRRPDGSPVCVACFCCQTACPPQCISIEAEESPDPEIEKRPKKFEINLLRCIFCGMCVEACPCDAIYMTHEYELANQTREQLMLTLEDLLDPMEQER